MHMAVPFAMAMLVLVCLVRTAAGVAVLHVLLVMRVVVLVVMAVLMAVAVAVLVGVRMRVAGRRLHR